MIDGLETRGGVTSRNYKLMASKKKKMESVIRESYEYIKKKQPDIGFKRCVFYVCYELGVNLGTVESYLPEEYEEYQKKKKSSIKSPGLYKKITYLKLKELKALKEKEKKEKKENKVKKQKQLCKKVK